ncbi:hypothetical protein [Nonlabens sp.]|uniref:hypothetical protein n=1 Tax=Nonlabens sp. TaxID=1888209 RepID=UPI001BCF7728|nr:hypothetical protein [Nonlabens sp.]
MNDFRKRPKDNYIQEADWQKLSVLSEQWKSDLMFYTDDLRFLHHIIDKYFLWISKKEHITRVQEIEANLIVIGEKCNLLLERINLRLAQLKEDPFRYDPHQFREEQETLENDLAQFLIDFRKNREEVFKVTEYLIEGEELVLKLHNISQ